MPRATETELKFTASGAMLDALRDHPSLQGPEETACLRSTYFDGVQGQLRAATASLRVREVDGTGHEQTLKRAGGTAVRRAEWTTPLPDDVPDADRFPPPAAGLLSRLLRGVPVQPYAVIEVTRTTRVIRHGVSTIQVAFDVGAARAGGRDEPICELELELTDGRLGDVLALAATLPLGPELRWSVLSKSERANRLAGAAAVVVPRAGRPGLRPSMTAVNGIRTIGWACLQHLLAAYEAVLANGDEEAIHQTRVATRRLRTAIGLLMKREGGERARVLLRELQAAARCLGQVRDIDVLIARLGDQRSATRTELIGGLRRSRDRACSAACAMLSGSQFQQLLVELARWVEDGSWNRAPSVRAVRIDSFSARWLNRLSRKLRKQAEGLAELADADLHRVRKTAKKLRYLAEFTGAAFPRATSQRARRKSVASLTEVQDSLGRIQDQIAAAQMAKALFEGEDVLTRARLEEELRLAEVSAIGRKHCLKVARHGLRSAFDAMPWWSAG